MQFVEPEKPRGKGRCYDNPSPNLLDTRNDTIESRVSIYYLVCKGLSINDVGVSRDTVFKEIRPGAGFKTGDFVQEKLWGRS